MYVHCSGSLFFVLFSFCFEPNTSFDASGASGSSNFALSDLRFSPTPLFFPLLLVFVVETSGTPVGRFSAALVCVWERIRQQLGGGFDVLLDLLPCGILTVPLSRVPGIGEEIYLCIYQAQVAGDGCSTTTNSTINQTVKFSRRHYLGNIVKQNRIRLE